MMKVREFKNEEKKAEIERLLGEGLMSCFIDSRRDDVDVPSQHKDNIQLILNFSYLFQVPDFQLTETQIEASLSFGPQVYFCQIPYDSIYVISSQITQETLIFPESVPSELLNLIMSSLQEIRDEKNKTKLSLVGDDTEGVLPDISELDLKGLGDQKTDLSSNQTTEEKKSALKAKKSKKAAPKLSAVESSEASQTKTNQKSSSKSKNKKKNHLKLVT